MVEDIMALAPFWTAATLPCGVLSNAVVENHFRDMKQKKVPGLRLTLAMFVSSRYAATVRKITRVVR